MRHGFGGGAIALLLFLTLGSFLAVLSRADAPAALSSFDFAAIRFTLFQAFLSAFFSVLLAIPLARVLARRVFWGRGLLLTILGAPFILPTIVAVFGLLAIWGPKGWASYLLLMSGQEPLNIFGLLGIVLAHVFFNLPLATRLFLQGWLSIPAEHFRLCASLGMETNHIHKHLERPMLKQTLPGAFLLIFLLAMTSFAIALTLGGGPKSTTIEVAIYQALRFDFDLSKTALLACIQFLLTLSFGIVFFFFTKPVNFGGSMGEVRKRWDLSARWTRWQDTCLIILGGMFLLSPLAAIFLRGLPEIQNLPAPIWEAAGISLLIALASTAICLLFAMAISHLILTLGAGFKHARYIEVLTLLTIAASPFVLGTGLYILIFPFASPFDLALPITAVVNAVMALPFAVRVILPAWGNARDNYQTLQHSLGMHGWSSFRIAIWPQICGPVLFAAGLAAALSMGDLGVITLFALPDVETLPLAMHRLMGAYQFDLATGAALLLLLLSLALFWAFDRGGRYADHL